jgi:hypothetical protein
MATRGRRRSSSRRLNRIDTVSTPAHLLPTCLQNSRVGMDFAASRRIAAIDAAREAFLVLGRRCHALQGSESRRSSFGLGDGCGRGYPSFEERLHRPDTHDYPPPASSSAMPAPGRLEEPETTATLRAAEQVLMAWKRAQIFGGLPPAKEEAQVLLEQLRSMSRRGGSQQQRQLMEAWTVPPCRRCCCRCVYSLLSPLSLLACLLACCLAGWLGRLAEVVRGVAGYRVLPPGELLASASSRESLLASAWGAQRDRGVRY